MFSNKLQTRKKSGGKKEEKKCGVTAQRLRSICRLSAQRVLSLRNDAVSVMPHPSRSPGSLGCVFQPPTDAFLTFSSNLTTSSPLSQALVLSVRSYDRVCVFVGLSLCLLACWLVGWLVCRGVLCTRIVCWLVGWFVAGSFALELLLCWFVCLFVVRGILCTRFVCLLVCWLVCRGVLCTRLVCLFACLSRGPLRSGHGWPPLSES